MFEYLELIHDLEKMHMQYESNQKSVRTYQAN